jgi:hypothetical protein
MATKKKTEIITLGTKNDPTELLAYRNTLKTVAQLRKAQLAHAISPKDQALSVEVKRLEAAVDLRLSGLGIKAI